MYVCLGTHTYFTHTLRSPSPSHPGTDHSSSFPTTTPRSTHPDLPQRGSSLPRGQGTRGSHTVHSLVPVPYLQGTCVPGLGPQVCKLQVPADPAGTVLPQHASNTPWESTRDGAGGPPSTQGSSTWTLWGPPQTVGYPWDRFPSAGAGSGEGQLQGPRACRAPAGEPWEDAGDEGQAPSHR